MAAFAVMHQRYADELTLTTIVEAATEYLASCKVWPEFKFYTWPGLRNYNNAADLGSSAI